MINLNLSDSRTFLFKGLRFSSDPFEIRHIILFSQHHCQQRSKVQEPKHVKLLHSSHQRQSHSTQTSARLIPQTASLESTRQEWFSIKAVSTPQLQTSPTMTSENLPNCSKLNSIRLQEKGCTPAQVHRQKSPPGFCLPQIKLSYTCSAGTWAIFITHLTSSGLTGVLGLGVHVPWPLVPFTPITQLEPVLPHSFMYPASVF